MVTTRSQSDTPGKRSAPINYAELANMTPSTSPRKRATASSSKRATSTSTTTSSSTRKTPQRKLMASPIVSDEIIVKSEDDDEHVNGSGVENRSRSPRKVPRAAGGTKGKGKPAHKVDKSGHFEFGGTFGTASMMFFFPILMYYLWVCSTFYGGSLQVKRESETWLAFVDRIVAHITKGAAPTLSAWVFYWVFIIVEGIFYVTLPGVQVKGNPLRHDHNRRLLYHCNAVWSLYVSIALVLGLHFSGVFKLTFLIDHYGSIMSVAVISGFLTSIAVFAHALITGVEHKMTGHWIYDFFMGAPLNPRIGKWLDLKMFAEVRIPWFILFFTTLAATLRQYETYGYVTPQMGVVLLGHYLYANACAKGEELIVPTWDMSTEKFGFMLIFWNMAGVPFTYGHATLFLVNHPPSQYRWPIAYNIAVYALLLGSYYIWDTTNSQKNRFRQQMNGALILRKTFPQLPWQTVNNPKILHTKAGPLLADGWYKYGGRKIHYTMDVVMALCWGFACGFSSFLPYWYPVWMLIVILQRANRDIAHCRAKYGEEWKEYERLCPYLFIPVFTLINLILMGSMFIKFLKTV